VVLVVHLLSSLLGRDFAFIGALQRVGGSHVREHLGGFAYIYLIMRACIR
jgi:hypothetical protein